MFSKKLQPSKKSEDVKKSAGKVLDAKKDTPTRSKHLRLFLDNAEPPEIVLFFENHYSHVFFIVYDAFIGAEVNLRQKGAHRAQREELESVLYLLEKVLLYLPEHLGRKWQYHAVGRLMSKLLHPGNSWKLIKREAMRLFIIWYQILGDAAGEHLHAMFATLVPGFPSPYQGLGLTALAALTPDIQDGPVNPAEICPLIPPQSGERWRSPETDLTRIFLDVLLELMVTQVPLVEWKEDVKDDRQRQCFDFLFERFKMYYMPNIFSEFNWEMSLYRPSLELPEVRHFRPAFVDTGDGTKKMDPMLACRVVVIKWVAQYTHLTRNTCGNTFENNEVVHPLNMSTGTLVVVTDDDSANFNNNFNTSVMSTRNTVEGNLVRDILYASRENINFVHEVYRQAFLLSFSHSPAIKKVITVYKDWIQMNVPELPPFLLEPPPSILEREREEFMQAISSGKMPSNDSSGEYDHDQSSSVRAGLQNVLQIFVTNAANVFLLEVSSEYPILLEEQVEMCKRVLNIYRYMVMNVKMEARTWEQLLFILLQITQLTLPEAPPRRREDTLGGRLAQAIFQTLIVTWIKANLYVVVSNELWDQFLEVLSSLTLWEELIREWAKTMETLTRVLARQVYNLDLNDLPLDRLTERAQKKRFGGEKPQETKHCSSSSRPMGLLQHQNTAPASTTNMSPLPPPDSSSSSLMMMGGPSIRSTPQDSHATRASPYFSTERKRGVSESEKHTGHQSRRGHQLVRQQRVHQHHTRGGTRSLNRSMSEGNVVPTSRYEYDEYDYALAAPPRKRSKSADSGRHHHHITTHHHHQRYRNHSESDSRSCSPAPSSGLECGSVKDSPMMQLDHDNMSEAGSLVSDMFGGDSTSGGTDRSYYMSSCTSTTAVAVAAANAPRSVMSGGSVKGWLPDVAVVLWRRMLGAMGNINAIGDTVIHAQIYKYLIELFDIMVKIRNNQGVSLDNLSTPKTPDYVPPFTIFAPWCFRALQLPDSTYQRGRLYALRLLCLCTVRAHDSPLAKTHLVQFFKVLHTGLTSTARMDMMYTLVKFTGPRFFSLMLPGYTAYVLDYLYAANTIISTAELKGVPRTEATSIVGALLAFPTLLSNIPVLLPNPNETTLIGSTDAKDQIIGVLLKSGKKEPAGLARCISLSSLGIFVYGELLHESFHPKIKEAIQVLLTALRFNNKAVAQIASDMILLLADHVDKLLDYYPEVPRKIVEVLARTLTNLMPRQTTDLGDEERRLLISLLFCLGEWVMRVPQFMLTQQQEDGKSLLQHVFSALLSASGGQSNNISSGSSKKPTSCVVDGKSVGPTGPAVMMNDFDPNIHVDNTKEGYASANASPLKSKRSEEETAAAEEQEDNSKEEDEKRSPVRLAANTLLAHFMNHLFHFPMGIGAASLSSMVSEHDDNPHVKATDDLSNEIFQAPNVQLFVLNDSTLMSFVELPVLASQSLAGIQTAQSQVRVILRDISGKFCWDATALYAPEDCVSSGKPCDLKNWPSPRHPDLHKNRLNSNNPVQALRHRNANILPSHEDAAEDLDNLDDLLQYIGHTSPECLTEPGRPLNAIGSAGHYLEPNTEKEMIAAVLGQRTLENDYLHRMETAAAIPYVKPTLNKVSCDNSQAFQQCRRFFGQLGQASWERRPRVHLMKKNDRLLRELRNLDNKRCREAHKIAVIYVGDGQEDKQSILSNTSGSQEFEDFVSGLGWEVELETHTGFMGGLSKSKATGETSPYFATSFVEVMFHVATRMPSHSEEALLTKTRHLGNDEVHIVWSEHWRDYRRGILPTEFCDVLIIIYPLKNGLFRVQVSRKPNVPYFGPLFNEVIVDKRVLPGLVRATSINASRAKRSMLSHYQTHYEERHYALHQIISNHKEKTSFEDFVTHVFSPSPLSNLFISEESSLSSSLSNLRSSSSNIDDSNLLRPRARTDVTSLRIENQDNEAAETCAGTSPKNLKKLTAAIRANINNNVARVNQGRPVSSVREEQIVVQSGQQQTNNSPPLLTAVTGTRKR